MKRTSIRFTDSGTPQSPWTPVLRASWAIQRLKREATSCATLHVAGLRRKQNGRLTPNADALTRGTVLDSTDGALAALVDVLALDGEDATDSVAAAAPRARR